MLSRRVVGASPSLLRCSSVGAGRVGSAYRSWHSSHESGFRGLPCGAGLSPASGQNKGLVHPTLLTGGVAESPRPARTDRGNQVNLRSLVDVQLWPAPFSNEFNQAKDDRIE
jgi:hypothetical protein